MSAAEALSDKPAFQGPAQSPTDQATQKVADRLYELCKAGKYVEAMQELYADDARQIEAMSMPDCPRVVEGKAALLEAGKKFAETMEIHDQSCGKPIVNGDQFVCAMSIDCTAKAGPMAGHRMQMNETCLYTVKNGKISEAKFFYPSGM
ncbi:MAG TPA: nuclear transport factor 2 family protein [Phycisphaerales bacterium]|nr:nuclear transport factor 2 family protein [Phycisphaerales bacterium]